MNFARIRDIAPFELQRYAGDLLRLSHPCRVAHGGRSPPPPEPRLGRPDCRGAERLLETERGWPLGLGLARAYRFPDHSIHGDQVLPLEGSPVHGRRCAVFRKRRLRVTAQAFSGGAARGRWLAAQQAKVGANVSPPLREALIAIQVPERYLKYVSAQSGLCYTHAGSLPHTSGRCYTHSGPCYTLSRQTRPSLMMMPTAARSAAAARNSLRRLRKLAPPTSGATA